MQYLTTQEIRTAFVDFFETYQHTEVVSASLIPESDPSLLFTNAGMVPFKRIFLGLEQRNYQKAVSIQRCLRAGGKHNDLENVGYTARHHTFFEMLGNFSFGDYFKRVAIQMAWQFLTERLAIPKEKLWVTVYQDDQETADIWLKEMKIDPKCFSYCDEKDNFWSMGATGPCGPCTEIFYDHGAHISGGPPGSKHADEDRYIEIWNLVFMQYDRDETGKLTPLPKPCVDTGMGLERIAAVLQGVHNNYQIDLFDHILQGVARLADPKHISAPQLYHNQSLCVIADHIRACGFLISDGILPSNEGRGYVLRRIIRRAIRHGHQLGILSPFLHQLVPNLIHVMGQAYPMLNKANSHIQSVLQQEEKQFDQTLSQGLKLLEQALTQVTETLSGDIVFKLYDTYGFPVDLTADIARTKGIKIDEAGFQQKMNTARNLAKQNSQFSQQKKQLSITQTSTFLGYDALQITGKIIGLFQNNAIVTVLAKENDGVIILDQTSFYPEGGGQVGDTGYLESSNGYFKVTDTQKQGNAILHFGKMLSGKFIIEEAITTKVTDIVRSDTMCNHSATHLLHSALRRVLGSTVVQKGSLVTNERLRFDFTHFSALIGSELNEIESLVNQMIRDNVTVETAIMTQKTAIEKGAIALFGEKYTDKVRVLTMGCHSIELCGGTHVKQTGDIGLFKLISESSVASGVRRIEAVTAGNAIIRMQSEKDALNSTAALLNTSIENINKNINQLQNDLKEKNSQIKQKNMQTTQAQCDTLLENVQHVGQMILLSARLTGLDVSQLRILLDQLRPRITKGVILLAGVLNEKIHFVASVDQSLTNKVKAGDLMRFITSQVDGKGGGRPDMAQGGGSNIQKLSAALDSVKEWLEEQ